MAFIKKIDPNVAQGRLKQVFDTAAKRAGYVAQVLQIMSLNPATLKASMELYLAAMVRPSRLSRAQREMIAVVVSRANHCYY